MQLKKVISNSYIYLHDVRFYAYHGVMPQENRVGGWYTVNLRVACDLSPAAESDDVNDTVSYADLYELLKREMAQPSKLLEHVAGRIVKAICQAFPQVEGVDLSITKDNPPMGADCQGAGVQLIIDNR
jgi:dihydroneopterin aldolase